MSVAMPPPTTGDNWKTYGDRLNKFLTATRNKLQFRDSEAKATEDGILMWDAAQDCPVISKGGAWIKLKLDP